MNFYRILRSLNQKEMGKIPHVKDVLYHGKVFDNPKFIDNIECLEVDYKPEIANPILYSKSKLTDLMGNVPAVSSKLLISGKFKEILQAKRNDGLQFFQSSVFQNGIEYPDYWYLNMYVVNDEYINCEDSIINWEKKTDDFDITFITIPEKIRFSSKEEFLLSKAKARCNVEIFYIDKLALQGVKEDFFMLRDIYGGVGFFVSEKLKNEIENAGCTGIEFQPSELSYNEWVAPGGERESVYGKSW